MVMADDYQDSSQVGEPTESGVKADFQRHRPKMS
jgi:hypothetical protein